jgi:hypothetical protein
MKSPIGRFLVQSLVITAAAFAPASFLHAQAPAASGGNPGDFYQFVNATGGAFTDSQVSWTFDGKTWHTLAEAKTAPRALRASGRINIKVQNDKGTWQDFIEYTHNNNWNGNTTYVDAFVFPMTIELFMADGSSKKLGIDQSRKALFDLFKKQAPPEFQSCVVTDKKTGEYLRIASPFQVDMHTGKPYEHYFDKYVDSIWEMYATPKTLPSGWTGKVENGVLTLSKPGAKIYTLNKKPTTQEILLGQQEMGKSADMCSAFNRHVFADPADWSDPSKYYKELPYNFYAKFWHEHTVDGKAYGFCYDDYAGQASYISAPGTKLVITIYWDAAPATQPKAAN